MPERFTRADRLLTNLGREAVAAIADLGQSSMVTAEANERQATRRRDNAPRQGWGRGFESPRMTRR